MKEIKKYPKAVQSDERGQIVIPKDIRIELKVDTGAVFYAYAIGNDAILLKKIDAPDLSKDDSVYALKRKSSKIGIKKNDVEKAVSRQKKAKQGKFEVIE